jgi:hypothetical protein
MMMQISVDALTASKVYAQRARLAMLRAARMLWAQIETFALCLASTECVPVVSDYLFG